MKEGTGVTTVGDMKESPFVKYSSYLQIYTPETLILFHNLSQLGELPSRLYSTHNKIGHE